MDIIAGDNFLGVRDQKGTRADTVGWGTLLQVAGSNPDGVTAIFHWHNPVRLRYKPNEPLIDMSTKNISGGKAGRCLKSV